MTGGLGGVDLGQHAFVVRAVGQRADGRRRVLGRADHGLRAEGREPLGEILDDVGVDEQARAGDAALAPAGEDGVGDAPRRQIEVGVGPDDVWGFAAQLHDHRLDLLSRQRCHRPTTMGAAGEADHAHVGVTDQRRPGGGAVAGDDIDHAGGQNLGVLQDLHQRQRRAARVLGGLDHRRVSRRQCRRQLPDQRPHRGVPRQEQRHYAEGLPTHVVVHVGHFGGDHPAFELVAEAGVVVPAVDLPAAFLQARCNAAGAAIVAELDLTQFVGLLGNQVADPAQHPAALGGQHPAPWAVVEGGLGGLHRAVDVGLAAVRHLRPDPAVGGVL